MVSITAIVHLLVHLVDSVRELGHLWTDSLSRILGLPAA